MLALIVLVCALYFENCEVSILRDLIKKTAFIWNYTHFAYFILNYHFNITMFNIQNEHLSTECCLINTLQIHNFLQFDDDYSFLLLWPNVTLTKCYQWQSVPLTKCYSDEMLYDESVLDEMLHWQNVIWRKCTWLNVTDPKKLNKTRLRKDYVNVCFFVL